MRVNFVNTKRIRNKLTVIGTLWMREMIPTDSTLTKTTLSKKENEMKKKRDNMKLSARHQQYNIDNEKWEAELLLRSGVVTQTNYDDDFEETTGSKIHILVHNITPPFLDGRTIFTKQPE